MKAITLWQPHATLVAIGVKKFETRSWSTHYRGPLIIHAAKRFEDSEVRLCFDEPFRTCLQQAGYRKASDLPLGAAIAMVDLIDILPVEQVVGKIDGRELAFGNYQPGRFAWELANLLSFPNPIPMRGRQGLWTLAQDELALIPNPINFWRHTTSTVMMALEKLYQTWAKHGTVAQETTKALENLMQAYDDLLD